MMALLFWPLLGALIGLAAAQRRGFSVAGGILGGLLLGPLAFLMFFVSGITRSDRRKQCPHCAEFVKAEATVCKHCHHAIAATARVIVAGRSATVSPVLHRGAPPKGALHAVTV